MYIIPKYTKVKLTYKNGQERLMSLGVWEHLRSYLIPSLKGWDWLV